MVIPKRKTFRGLKRNYGAHNYTSTQAISEILKKFLKTGSVTESERVENHRFARSSSNIPAIL